MSFMFELYYAPPEDLTREARIIAQVEAAGGRLDYREPATEGPICLTFEFDSRETATAVESDLRKQGEHTEGVCDYG